METPQLRQAQESEAAVCAELVIMSAPELFEYMYCASGERLQSLFEDFFSTPGTTYSRENIVVECSSERIRGLLLSFAVSGEGRLIRGELRSLLRWAGGFFRFMNRFLKMGWRLLRVARYPKLEKDELFISDLAVFPEFRGQGIGSRLLDRSVEIAKESGLRKVSLFVEVSNHGAQSLYKKNGFVLDSTRMFSSRGHDLGSIGFHKMVKIIS